MLVLVGVGLVSYWVYRDAAAREMDDAPYWGTAVGVASVIGVVVGGIVAVGVYLSEGDAEVGPGRDTPEPDTGADHRRHLGRPRLRGGDVGETADTGEDTSATADGPSSVTEEEATDRWDRGFGWVEET